MYPGHGFHNIKLRFHQDKHIVILMAGLIRLIAQLMTQQYNNHQNVS